MSRDLDQASYASDGGGDIISNTDIMNAVRKHLKMAPHIPVSIADSEDDYGTGGWRIQTTDIEADGVWTIEAHGGITINLGEMVTQGEAPYVYEQDELSAKLAAFRAARGAGAPDVTMTVKVSQGTTNDKDEIEEPDDGPIIQLQDRTEDVARNWDAISKMVYRAIERGDVDALRQARDAMPHLGAQLLHMLTAMSRAIEQAE